MAVRLLAVKHHQQDTDYYCGAACAQMVLETIGAGILDQDDLYADNHGHSVADAGVNWATAPDGLTWTMNDRRPAGFTNSFVLFALDTEESISRKICWTIQHYQVAPIALVYGWAHWIVVHGYDVSAHPASSGDNGYSIAAFDVNNPWPPTPAGAAEPPHTNGDDCGTGGDRGVADEHVTYDDWQDTYMTGVPGGHWNGKFVAVCDPEPPARPGGAYRRRERLPGRQILAPREAAERLLPAFKDYGLLERKEWQRALEGTETGNPLLVRRLDLPDHYYYLAPLRQGRRVSALARLDARYGFYRGALRLTGERSLWDPLTPAALLERVAGKRFELPTRRGRLLVRKEAICLFPTLVWRPCRESLSPYWPFYMLTIGEERLYVRIDGAVFTALHYEPGI
jgi:hypothetical protein